MASDDAERTCGWCGSFCPLTDEMTDGVCLVEMRDALGVECDPMAALDWIYDSARNPNDRACELWEEAK